MQYVSKRITSRLQINHRGNAILLILPLAIVVVAVIQLSLYQAVNFSKTVSNFRVLGVRDNLISNLKAYASMPTTFRSSLHMSLPAGTNSELQSCVLGGGAPCQHDIEMPVALYSPISSASGTVSLKMISGRADLGGPLSPAALYDIRGTLCATTGQGNNECPFEVTTSFIPKCPGNTPTCAIAESISVKYTVRKATASSLMKANSLRASIEQYAPMVLVSKILPGSVDDANGNITTSSLAGVNDPTEDSEQNAIKARIEKAIRDSKITTIESHIQEMTQVFYENGYTDPDFIQAVVKVAYFENDTPGIIKALHDIGIKDTETAVFLSHVGISDPKWMQIVLDTGIKNTWMAGNLYWNFQDADIDRVRVAIEVVKDLPDNQLSLSVARNITDPTKAKEVYDNVKNATPSEFIAAGVLDGKWYNDPNKIDAISKAITNKDDWTALSFAKLGLTDKSQVDALVEAIKPLEDSGRGAEYITQAGGDIEKTKQLVTDWLNQVAQWKAEAAAQQAAADNTTPAPQTPSTGSGAITPPDITLLSTCTTCSGVTF